MQATSSIIVRHELETDRAAIHALNLQAFETSAEAELVDTLRRDARPFVSLVALAGDALVGQIAFSPATLDPVPGLRIAGLGPMAVAPARQREGIGSALVEAGLEGCRAAGFVAVVVLGHADYYPRFGFVPASRFDLGCEYDVPDEVFMARELVPGALADNGGLIRYHPAFASV